MRYRMGLLFLLMACFLALPTWAEERHSAAKAPTVVPLNEYINMLREYYKGRGITLEGGTKDKTPRAKDRALDEWNSGLQVTGRFQALNVFDGKAVLILDTKEGHLWIWALPSVIYGGRIFPGEVIGEEILSIPAP
jgi:hypothetical protein